MICTVEGLTSTKAARLRSLRESQDSEIPEAYLNHDECEPIIEQFRDGVPLSLKDRLFLQPSNEYGTKKLVCTFLQPTLLPYPELYDLKRCANFVSRYCQYEPLEDGLSLEVPVVSPAQTLEWAVGDCFDYSFLLASLLIGAGHNAFVVYGTAPEWIRIKDQSHMQCNLSQRSGDDVSNPWSLEVSIGDEDYAGKPSYNDGLHCWVLVTKGKRDLDGGEHCFVETSTGILYPVRDSPYSQVFSIWNDRNCWLSIGDGSIDGADGLDYLDFANSEKWMPVLPDMYSAPYSWVNALDLPKEKFLIRYTPDGKRTINVNKAKVEFYGENADPQGVMSRVIQYEDVERTTVVECNEFFFREARADGMIQRTRRPMENMIHEYFSRGSEMCERKEVGKLRFVKFHEKARAEGVVERIEEFGSSITEHFLDRPLLRRTIHISLLPKDVKKPKSSEVVSIGSKQLAVIERIDEHFKAPKESSAVAMTVKRERDTARGTLGTETLENSVACRSYLLKERSIRVNYHCEHDVLRREEEFSKDGISNDAFGKELIKLQNESVYSVKKIMTDMSRITESKYDQEIKLTERSPPTTLANTTLSLSGKKDEATALFAIDYLSPYLNGENQRLSKEEAIRVKNECLKDMKERLLDRGKVIQSKLSGQRQEKVENTESDVLFRIELLKKRLAEHEKKAITKYKALEEKLNQDIRLASLSESE